MKVAELHQLIIQRDITLPEKGSGKNGQIVKKDLISALFVADMTEETSKMKISSTASPDDSLPVLPDISPKKSDTIAKRYGKLVKVLGKGSYGEVSLYQTKNGTQYAIKKIKYLTEGFVGYELDSTSLREIAIMQRMNHPNIVELIDYTTSVDKESLYLVMPFMDRGDLYRYIRSDDYNAETEALSLSYQILCGLSYMHSLDIIHRDIKPQNILIDHTGRAKIADFGISRALSCVDPGLKSVDAFTLWYRPPELLYGGRGSSYGRSADVWSTGCTIYELVTGKPLFAGQDEAEMRDLFAMLLGPPSETVWPEVSKLPAYKPEHDYPDKDYQRIIGYISDKITNSAKVKQWETLIMSMLKYDPATRKSAIQLLKSQMFDPIRNTDLEAKKHSCLETLYASEELIDFKPAKITLAMKLIVLEWIFSLKLKFRLRSRTYYIAIYLHDYLREKLNIARDSYQLYGAACLYIASVYNEIYSPEICDFIYMTNNAYTKKQFTEMIDQILREFEFSMVFSTSYDFIVEYGPFYSYWVGRLARGLLYFTTLLPERLYRTKPDQLALMTLMMACAYYNYPFKHFSKISNQRMLRFDFCSEFRFSKKLTPNLIQVFKDKRYTYTKDGADIMDVLKKICTKKPTK